jgi:hypothetical protein
MGKYEYLASISLLLNIFSFITLIINVYNTGDTSNFTWFYLFGNVISQTLLIIYAKINNAWGIYLPTGFILIGILFILFVKIKTHVQLKSS